MIQELAVNTIKQEYLISVRVVRLIHLHWVDGMVLAGSPNPSCWRAGKIYYQ